MPRLSPVQESVYFAAELWTQTQSVERIITLFLQEIRGTFKHSEVHKSASPIFIHQNSRESTDMIRSHVWFLIMKYVLHSLMGNTGSVQKDIYSGSSLQLVSCTAESTATSVVLLTKTRACKP